MNEILYEILKILSQKEGIEGVRGRFRAVNPRNNSETLFVPIRRVFSKRKILEMMRTIKGIVEISNDNKCAKNILSSLEVEYPAIFFGVAMKCGYTAQLNAVISLDYFMTMSEVENLRVSK